MFNICMEWLILIWPQVEKWLKYMYGFYILWNKYLGGIRLFIHNKTAEIFSHYTYFVN